MNSICLSSLDLDLDRNRNCLPCVASAKQGDRDSLSHVTSIFEFLVYRLCLVLGRIWPLLWLQPLGAVYLELLSGPIATALDRRAL
ncbi:MAG: hypothetical protein A2W80_09605 [Candidatus Riflebacteria bacterium GWC2_50_8]|nr:MAG: hypothetical protein A2W80_09605 [Candidatus Riflebacteria bacterium GWC2_50_8]